MLRVYTRRGDAGETDLLYGVRLSKDHPAIRAIGAVDEAQAALGLARAEAAEGSELWDLLVGIERDLWLVMGEIASQGGKPRISEARVSAEMISALEREIDRRHPETLGRGFVLPGENRLAAALDFARAVVRRAEREVVSLSHGQSLTVAYLNRLSDLCWVLARSSEVEHRMAREGRGRSAELKEDGGSGASGS